MAQHTARHAACEHDDYTTHGWPRYCTECADPTTIAYLVGDPLSGGMWVEMGSKVTSHRAARVSVAA
jgi:hypothetical protein